MSTETDQVGVFIEQAQPKPNGSPRSRRSSTLLHGRTVLVVDDEPQMGQLLQNIFGQAGARVITAGSGEAGLEFFREIRPDLVLLDVMMPGMGGLDLCRHIRHESTVPVIVVTVVSRATEIVSFLDAGADDYVTKPFNTQVLLARARAALRRSTHDLINRAVYDDGYMAIFVEDQRVVVNGDPVKLSNTEFKLLTYLLEHAGQTCSFSQILTNVWGEEFRYNAEYVHVYIWRLRQKLERDPRKPRYLMTEHSLGYRFADGYPQ